MLLLGLSIFIIIYGMLALVCEGSCCPVRWCIINLQMDGWMASNPCQGQSYFRPIIVTQ